jgi:dTDP-L-rhamnose 4-epimerase
MRVLLTGAGGFIGSAVRGVFEAAGHDVLGVDALIPQAHATPHAADPTLIRADVRDQARLLSLLHGVDVVAHQAALVGAGTSAADLPAYASHNDLGTATLLAAMYDAGVHRLVLASSMVVYGEGRYECPEHGKVAPGPRDLQALSRGEFDPTCSACGRVLKPVRVDEATPLRPRGAYAASKSAQEHYAAAWALQTNSAVVSLRYHNVYGAGMPRDTPYAGAAAIFRSQLAGGRAPEVFEDGAQLRDFVHVRDVAEANRLAADQLRSARSGGVEAYNVCFGRPISIAEVARILADATGGPRPVTTGRFRVSDVRHVIGSPRRAADRLGFRARIPPDTGLRSFAREPMRPTR